MKVVELKNEGTVWTLTIQRPESLNALNAQVLEELASSLKEIENKSYSECRALVITGSGEKAFVAGADIKEIGSLEIQSSLNFANRGQSILRRIENLKIPVIAAVNGFALGGGLELALACDFIYASDNAKLGLPEVTLGLIPGFGGTVRLSRVVGLARAKEIIFSGEMLSADEAVQCGLVNKVVPQADLISTVMKLAQKISIRGPVAVGFAKKSVMDTFDQNVDEAMQTEAKYFSELFKTKDVKEGTSAFVEKRKAQFKGN